MPRQDKQIHAWKQPVAPRPAATVLLLRDAEDGLEVLMTRRSEKATFVPGAYVFPGGALDTADASRRARQLSRLRAGQEEEQLTFSTAAIREAFEELGVLLAYRPDGSLAVHEDVARLDRSQDADFLGQMDAGGYRLAVDRVWSLCHWTTDPDLPKRFDVRFLVARMPEAQEPESDDSETFEPVWISPERALERHERGDFLMIFPTIRTLRRLAQMPRVDAVLDACAGDRPLWPSQQQGIAQALWILETVGSVLISDATGSGKTRLGAHLLRAVMDRIWRFGRIRRGRAVLVAPPSVSRSWQSEATLAGAQLEVRSHGKLSYRLGSEHDEVVEAVRRAQVLAVDEAHNFLNRVSERSRVLLSNMADHTILFTATPINRSAADLLRLADVLGADNLAEETLEAFEDMLRHPNKVGALSEHQLERLRAELRRFTVRRTKSMLNALVDQAPEQYQDVQGKLCRYPKHLSKTYELHESSTDCRLAAEIRAATEELVGACLVSQPVELPASLRREGWSEEKFLQSRLTGIRRLSTHLVMSALRSSRCALVEHLIGTSAALAEFKLQADQKRQATGNVIGKLESRAGQPPGSRLSITDVPTWMTDPDEHRRVCEADAAAGFPLMGTSRFPGLGPPDFPG